MIIETERLIISPFTKEICEAAKTGDIFLYKKLNIIPNNEWPENDLRDAMDEFTNLIKLNGITGYGSWIILNKKNQIICSAGFIGEPKNKMVEIGFGIIPSQQNKGYCTEALLGLIKWAKQDGKAKVIIAYCNTDNIKSQRVLEKAGFKNIGNENENMKWEYRVFST